MQKENIFQTVFHLNKKSIHCVRTFVDIKYGRVASHGEPHKAHEKWSLAYVQVN